MRVVVDLRTGEEVRLEGDGPLVGDGRIEIRHRSLYPEKGKLTDVMISRADGEMPAVRYYLRYLRDRPDSIVGALEDIASADGAVLVHCAAGKDRTGVVVALALAAVGRGARGDRRRLRPHRRADRRDHGPPARLGDLPRRPRALTDESRKAAGRDHRARARGARRARTAAPLAGCASTGSIRGARSPRARAPPRRARRPGTASPSRRPASSGATTTIAPGGRQLGQVRELGQAVLARRRAGSGGPGTAGRRSARRPRRCRRSRTPNADDRRGLGQPARGLGVRAGRLAAVEERLLVVGAGVPAGAQEQPAAGRAAGRARSPRPGCRPA